MADLAEIYRQSREALINVVEGHRDKLTTKVPACPDWSVQDVIAHVTGIVADTQAGKTEGVGSEAWTAAQVESRRGLGFDDVVREWIEKAGPLESMLASAPRGLGMSLIGDLISHTHDVQGALGETRNRDSEGVGVAFDSYVFMLGRRLKGAGLPALRLVADGQEVVAGEGEPGATVSGSKFELLRALTGRRSAAQVRSLFVSGEPESYVNVFSAYGMPENDVVE